MSTTENGSRWVTVIVCPHCREEHQVCWPHASFPCGSARYSFECPQSTLRVVFAAATVWGEVSDVEGTSGLPIVSACAE